MIDLSSLEREIEEAPRACDSDAVKFLVAALRLKIVNDALSKGIRIIYDLENNLYESAIALYNLLAQCNNVYGDEEVGIVRDEEGRPYAIRMYFGKGEAEPNAITVVFKRVVQEQVAYDIEDIAITSNLVYFYVDRSPPPGELSVFVYYRGLLSDLIRAVFKRLADATGDKTWLERLRYLGVVPFDSLVLMDFESVKRLARTWRPPPPPYTDYLDRARGLDEVVVPEEVRRWVERFIEIVRYAEVSSMLVIGLPSSGRRTLAGAVARALELPAFAFSIHNVLSKYLGESQRKLKTFFSAVRSKRCVVVIDGLEELFRARSGGSEGSEARADLYTIFMNNIAHPENRFIPVLISDVTADPELLESPLLGELKIVVPPPAPSERKALARLFLRELAGERWGALVRVVGRKYGVDEESAVEVLSRIYADPIAVESAGLTSGELYRVMKTILVPKFSTALSRGTLPAIDEELDLLSKRDYTSRQARLKLLREKAVLLGLTDIAEYIYNVEEEVRAKAIRVAKAVEHLKT